MPITARTSTDTKLTALQKAAVTCVALYSVGVFCYGVYGGVTGSSDQKSFYYTTKLLLEKKDAFRIGSDFIRTVPPGICYFNYKGINDAGGYGLYPPSTHVLFLPFSGFAASLKAAKYSWLCWNLVFIGILFFVVSKKYMSGAPGLSLFLFFLLVIGSPATKTNMSLGQTGLFSSAAFLLTLFFRNKHTWLAAAAFTLAVSKPSLMLFFSVYLLVKKEYRIVFTALCVHLVLTLLLSLWIETSPFDLIGNYFEKVSLSFSHTGSLLVLQVAGISVKSILHLALPAWLKSSIVGMLYVAVIVFIYVRRDMSELRMLGFISLATLLVDYHHHYDFVILFMLFPLMVQPVTDPLRKIWPFFYYLFLLYLPNFSRLKLFGFATSDFFWSHHGWLLVWQIFYTSLFLVLLIVYAKCSRHSPEVTSSA